MILTFLHHMGRLARGLHAERDRFDAGTRPYATVLGLAAGLAIASSASASGWGANPEVLVPTVHESAVTIPLRGSVVVAQMQDGVIQVQRLNTQGDPFALYSYVDGDADPDVPIAGCRVGPNKIALGYSVYDEDNLRVVFLKRVGSSFAVVPGFPITIGRGFGLKMDPYAIRPKTDNDPVELGLMMCWLHAYGAGPHSPVAVRQQGLRLDGTLVWPAHSANGAYVGETLMAAHDAHSITSDNRGLAVATYLEAGDSSMFETTKLDLSATPLFSQIVPGQMGYDIPPHCFVASDGTGGAFYAFARNAADTQLAIAQVQYDGTDYLSYDAAFEASPSTTLRPLAIVATPAKTAVIAYRNAIAVKAVKVGPGLGFHWASFLSGATNDDSEQAHGVSGPCGVVFSWTRFDVLIAKLLDQQSGTGLWGEVPVDGPSEGSFPRVPHVINSRGTGAIVTWFDETNAGIRAERVRCAGGTLGP